MSGQKPRVAVVTGARRGIGAAIVARLAASGLTVAAGVRSPGDVAGAALTVTGDVTRPEAVAGLVREVTDRLGPIDVLVNNAGGFTHPTPTLETTDDEWSQQLALNLTSAFLLCRAVAPDMVRRGWGRIVNVASVVGVAPALGNAAAYVAAKSGLIGFSRQLALEIAGSGVTVNVVNPGTTLTEHLVDYFAASGHSAAELAPHIPAGRLGTPPEVAAAVSYFVGEDAGFTTGASLTVSGGVAMN